MIRSFIKVVKKGWGREEWVANSPMYCAKFLHVDRNKKCSLHYHERKFETFAMVTGRVKLEVEGCEVILNTDEVIDIYPCQKHRFTGLGSVSVILEVSTQHFEFDSIRVEEGD